MFNILELFAALSPLNAWFTILHGGNSWWLHQKPTGTSKFVESSAASLTVEGRASFARRDGEGKRRKKKKGERKINDIRISVIVWWFCEGDTRATRGGNVGNDKLRFDFISRGDDRHHGAWRNRGRKKEKKERINRAVESIVYSITEWDVFLRITLRSVILLLLYIQCI